MEDGVLNQDIPVLVMSIDNVGSVRIKLNGETLIFESGMDQEFGQTLQRRGGVIAASTSQSTASRFLRRITALLPKNSKGEPLHRNFVILYKNMGTDAATSNVSFFAKALERVSKSLILEAYPFQILNLQSFLPTKPR